MKNKVEMSEIKDFILKESKEYDSITIEPSDNFPSVVDRYYSRFYKKFSERPDEDHIILFHSNRICLIGLAKSHIALKKGITEVIFDVGNADRSLNKVTGKGKKGGMNMQPDSCLAIVRCNDGSEYKVLSCINGKLIEVNPRIVKNPDLMLIEGDGYVGIVLPKPEKCEDLKKSLMTQMDYEDFSKRNMDYMEEG